MYNLNSPHKYVNTAELKLAKGNSIIESGPLGTCIAIALYDTKLRQTAMAHILLPRPLKLKIKKEDQNKYASFAVRNAIDLLKSNNSDIENIIAFYAGAANVLKRQNENTHTSNIEAIENLCTEYNIPVAFKKVGGYERRSLLVDLSEQKASISEGSIKEKFVYSLVEISKKLF